MNKKIPYDQCYKLLFSEPVMVKDLLLGFFNNNWADGLDFSTLQRLNQEHVTDDLCYRESDLIWKVRWKDDWYYLLILIEFQSTVDPFMAVRVLSYVSLLYQSVIKEDDKIRKFKKLPPVLPIVLYNGEKPWNAPVTFSGLIPESLPKMLRKYQPDFTYWLLDEGEYIIDKVSSGNLVALLIALEQSQKPEDALAVLDRLVKLLQGPEFDSLRRAYTIYFERILRAKETMPDLKVHELQEGKEMLSERIDLWMKQSREKGLSQGISEGISEGISQGELAVIKRQLTKRFGGLTMNQENILKNKSAEELLEISERLLDATSIEEIM